MRAIVFLAACVACAPESAPAPVCDATGCWSRVLPLGSGGFPADPGSNDSPKWEPGKFPLTLRPALAADGRLWMASRVHAFSSTDGLAWTHLDKTDWNERIAYAFTAFGGKLFMYGGLAYDTKLALNDMWTSTDGATWTNLGAAPWSAREGTAIAERGGKLWLFGGTTAVDTMFNATAMVSDGWSSDDGIAWTQVTASAGWPARNYPRVVVFNGAFYLIGGEGLSDVWRSDDGMTWTELTPAAPWGVRYAYATLVFDGKIWVFGGYPDKPTNAMNDVWYSTDGVTWTEQTASAPWGPRDPVTSIVFHNRIWMFSGKHTGGPDNWGGDLWTFSVL